ncbi:MAG: hypothetical protein A2V81_00765 [Candidatus Abawacabacteria bacterium RBG_16_42_10]|uniref:SLH domain-containing protein n=1 Tax=Candidatus Abawacabacteria bacterium RBG_16_42_10 TaxID=1817814 RepID=A0A1F4XHZ0_9BACT|nr:MAG: hypothetical protein A2V81_00765 [Candidatus Abawacabacteria bacterium RBG_16_42_10]
MDENIMISMRKFFIAVSVFVSVTTPVFAQTEAPEATPTATEAPTAEVIFSDVSSDHWAYSAIQALVKKKVMNGYSDGSFGPDKLLTRAETTKILVLATQDSSPSLDEAGVLPFTDIDPLDPLLPFISFAFDHNIIKGYLDGTFRPTRSISRAEFMKIFILTSENLLENYNIGEAFLDVVPNHDLAPHIYSSRALGYIKGSSNGLFLPDIPITRAEASKVIFNYLADKDMEFPEPSDLEQAMFDAINEKRTSDGKPVLTLDNTLSGVAHKQSQDLSDQWSFLDKDEKKEYETTHANVQEQDKRRPWTSHRNITGQTFDEWFALASKKYDFNYSDATQNIAHAFYDNSTPEDRVLDIINKMFEKDEQDNYLYAHAYNILGTYIPYTNVGIGIVVGEDPEEMYVTQIFTK